MGLLENEFLVYLSKFDTCCFEAGIGRKKYKIGNGEPLFRVNFKNLPDVDDMLFSTSIALGECYSRGYIDVEGGLYEFLVYFLNDMDKFLLDKKKLKKIFKKSRSTKVQGRKIKKHFDLGSDFFEMILDDTMSYSSGYFKSENDSLHDAQQNKIDYFIKKLRIKKEMSLCEIGCSRSSILIEAAKKYKVNGLLVTMSKSQKKEMEQLIEKENLTKLIDVQYLSYKELPKLKRRFDCIIAVTLMENVGNDRLEDFFESLNAVMKENATLLIQSLDMPKEKKTDPWIKKYVIPSMDIPYLPNLLLWAMKNNLYIEDIQSIREHYAKTYLCWYENLLVNADFVEEIFDKNFVRTWELYLAAFAAALNIKKLDAHQIILKKGMNNHLIKTNFRFNRLH